MPTLMTIREPDPFDCLDRIASEPIRYCVDCGEVEVSAKGQRCAECLVEWEADPRDEPTHEDYGSEVTP